MKTSKAHLEYWKSVLRKQKLVRENWETLGKGRDWEVYIQHRGRREWFSLGTPNKEAAATVAREIYHTLRGGGWKLATERFKPEMARITQQPTVGEYLKAVEKHASLRSYTYLIYSSKLRSLVASIRGEAENPARFDHIKGGNKQWRESIDKTNLSRVTIPAIQVWKKQCLKKSGDSPLDQAKARRTINSTLRNAKSLFAPGILKQLPFNLVSPLPFEGVDFEKVAKPRYHSRINTIELLAAARKELPEACPEAYKIFVLALQLGLRRREIDGLLWSQFDFQRGILRVETTEHTELKTTESEQEIDVGKDLAQELLALQQKSFSKFVIAAPFLKSRYGPGVYRCDKHFARLIAWLKIKGIQDDKPIHTLRKEFGSVIAASHGIFAASTALRHSNISVTRDHYLDKKAPIYFSLDARAVNSGTA